MDTNFHINFQGFSDPDSDKSILRDSQNRYRVNIMYEINRQTVTDEKPSLYTMREEPWEGLPSAYKIYMFSSSEYEAALKLVGSWQHWQRLCQSPSFMNGIPSTGTWVGLKNWREEKEIKDRATAFNLLKIAAASGNVPAQKILFEKDKVGVRGRPSKAQVEQAAKEAAEHESFIKDDLARLRLVANNGD